MRETVRDKERLEHIMEALQRTQASLDKWGKEMFMQDKTFFFGLVKNLEIIGEATYKLTKEFKDSHSEMPWAYMEKMRHILVPGYYLIEEKIIWETIESDLPEITPIIKKYLNAFKSQG